MGKNRTRKNKIPFNLAGDATEGITPTAVSPQDGILQELTRVSLSIPDLREAL
jgi:hypothetical protein